MIVGEPRDTLMTLRGMGMEDGAVSVGAGGLNGPRWTLGTAAEVAHRPRSLLPQRPPDNSCLTGAKHWAHLGPAADLKVSSSQNLAAKTDTMLCAFMIAALKRHKQEDLKFKAIIALECVSGQSVSH